MANLRSAITRQANRWFIAFKRKVAPRVTEKTRERIGIDLGVKTLATCSDGTRFPNVKAYRRSKRKLAHLQRSLSRKQKGSSNREKARKALTKLCYRISCIRKDAIHKLTLWLAKNHSVVALEDLNVSGMLRNNFVAFGNQILANAIADCGFYELRRQFAYKADLSGFAKQNFNALVLSWRIDSILRGNYAQI